MLIVKTHSQTVTGEKRCALIPRHAQHAVFGVEVGFLRRTVGMIAVIDFMSSPVIEETQGAGALFIMVFESERSHAARDAGVIVYVRITGLARIGGLELRDVYIAPQFPGIVEVISQLGIAAVLFKLHIVAMPVGTVVRAGDNTAETPFPDAVGNFRLQCVVGAVADLCMGLNPVFLHLAGYDIDNAAHSVRAIQHRGRAAKHFHPVGQHGLIGIGNGMSH